MSWYAVVLLLGSWPTAADDQPRVDQKTTYAKVELRGSLQLDGPIGGPDVLVVLVDQDRYELDLSGNKEFQKEGAKGVISKVGTTTVVVTGTLRLPSFGGDGIGRTRGGRLANVPLVNVLTLKPARGE